MHVTAENQTNIGGMAGGAAVGLLLAGPLGALVGAWLKSGAKTSQIAIIQLVDGTSTVAQMSAVELATLLSALPRAEQLRTAADDFACR